MCSRVHTSQVNVDRLQYRAFKDNETLGTLPLKLEWDERNTIAGWGAGVKTLDPHVDQQVAGRFNHNRRSITPQKARIRYARYKMAS